MTNNFFKGALDATFHFRLLKTFMIISSCTGLLIYISMHIFFIDLPFKTGSELTTLVKLISIASGFALCISIAIPIAGFVDLLILKKKRWSFPMQIKIITPVLIATIVLLSACNTPLVKTGIKKDFNTGMTTSYTGIEPEKVFLVMNNEVLNHTDIPIGESFLVVNDGIKGMQTKDGKVKVGCSLSITDQQGKVLLNEKDLFAGHDEFEEKDAKMLKCTVSTGEPMKWEEKYNVAVTFWDKNGNGKIENKLTIRSIDIP